MVFIIPFLASFPFPAADFRLAGDSPTNYLQILVVRSGSSKRL